MNNDYIFTSLTRITDFQESEIRPTLLERSAWKKGDYIVAEIYNNNSPLLIELCTGRMIRSMHGKKVIGALGDRFATLEATGSWNEIGEDGFMHMLTGAGLLGKLSSKSWLIPDLIELRYIGHVFKNGQRSNMSDYVLPPLDLNFNTPSILLVGTSMSAGKTTAARIIINELVKKGLKVVGAKLTGAGRYRDILSMQDAGASYIYDFVEMGLASSIGDQVKFTASITNLLSHIQSKKADVAVLEIGASPLEPYNGAAAIKLVEPHVVCSVLCASDPYAVYGVMQGFGLKPDIVSGIATNTLAGIELVEKLCSTKAINLIDPNTIPELQKILFDKLNL